MPKPKVEINERVYQFYAASARLLRAHMQEGDLKERARVMAHRRAFMGVRNAAVYFIRSVPDEVMKAMERRLAHEDRIIKKALKAAAQTSTPRTSAAKERAVLGKLEAGLGRLLESGTLPKSRRARVQSLLSQAPTTPIQTRTDAPNKRRR